MTIANGDKKVYEAKMSIYDRPSLGDGENWIGQEGEFKTFFVFEAGGKHKLFYALNWSFSGEKKGADWKISDYDGFKGYLPRTNKLADLIPVDKSKDWPWLFEDKALQNPLDIKNTLKLE